MIFINSLLDSPRSHMTLTFHRQFPQIALQCDLSHYPATSLLNHLDWYILLEISIYGLISLQLCSFQSQNLYHNRSTQHMTAQRSDLASMEGRMTYRVWSQTGFPNKYFLLIQVVSLLSKYCHLLRITSNLCETYNNWKPWGKDRGEAALAMALYRGP